MNSCSTGHGTQGAHVEAQAARQCAVQEEVGGTGHGCFKFEKNIVDQAHRQAEILDARDEVNAWKQQASFKPHGTGSCDRGWVYTVEITARILMAIEKLLDATAPTPAQE